MVNYDIRSGAKMKHIFIRSHRALHCSAPAGGWSDVMKWRGQWTVDWSRGALWEELALCVARATGSPCGCALAGWQHWHLLSVSLTYSHACEDWPPFPQRVLPHPGAPPPLPPRRLTGTAPALSFRPAEHSGVACLFPGLCCLSWAGTDLHTHTATLGTCVAAPAFRYLSSFWNGVSVSCEAGTGAPLSLSGTEKIHSFCTEQSVAGKLFNAV